MKSILEFCSGLPELNVAEGDDIIVEGEKGKSLFILKEGEVEIIKQETQVRVIDSPGSIFGEISILLDIDSTATVRTTKPTTFYLVEEANSFLKDHPEINHHIAQLLARRLNSVTTYLVDLKQQFESHKDHLGMVDEVLESILHQNTK